jgi:hypothetical protein
MPELDLADVRARIARHRGQLPTAGTAEFLDLSRLIDVDAPALLETATKALTALDRIEAAAENLLAELEQRETDALFSGAAEPSDVSPAGAKALRMALLAVPAGLPEVPGEASCT